MRGHLEMHGSRRRRLWELETMAYCPVIGVCLPLQTLRQLVEKVLGGPAPADDYELHCCTINECKQRSPVAERLHKELEQRYALPVRQAARCKCTESLAQWWTQCRRGGQVPGALWAVMTHPRCDKALADAVLADVHMLQHQVGAAQRVDLERHAQLQREHAQAVQELGALQERSTRAIADKSACIEVQAAQLAQLRAELVGRDTLVAALREELVRLEAAVPGLRTRLEQAAQLREQQVRMLELQRELLRWQQRAASLQAQLGESAAPPTAEQEAQAPSQSGDVEPADVASALRDKAVLCVGGRPGSVPVYRQIIEGTGGRFLHHDGGEEHNPAQLDTSLAAADLVICQTGCISHDAYWRVKDHCKRHGKQCVFVEKPSATSLARGLQAIDFVQQARAVRRPSPPRPGALPEEIGAHA